LIRINIKKGVVFNVIGYEFCALSRIVFRVFEKYNVIPTLTSAYDGEHVPDSWHYKDLGWDWRTWGLADPKAAADAIRRQAQALDYRYDVIFGDKKHLDHIHTQYDLNKKNT